MEIGERIKLRRLELEMSQEELAKKLGYTSKTTIAKIEANANQLRQSKIKQIADALDTTPSYIMGWDEEVAVPKVENVGAHVELIRLYDLLTEEQQKAIIHMMRTMANR